MVQLFPQRVNHYAAGGYALVGAAAMGTGVTRAMSTAIICFELTGELTHRIM